VASDSLFKVLLLDAFVRGSRRVFLAARKRATKKASLKRSQIRLLCARWLNPKAYELRTLASEDAKKRRAQNARPEGD
jgi:hypothetical protein